MLEMEYFSLACFKLIIHVINVIKHFCYSFIVPVRNCTSTQHLPPYTLNYATAVNYTTHSKNLTIGV